MNELDTYLSRWGLITDGELIITPYSILLPVLYKKMPAMLKFAMTTEERTGGNLMLWWNGQGAARILAHDGDALLMERAIGEGSLIWMAKNHQDDKASQIICAVATILHRSKNKLIPSTLIPLSERFKALEPAASQYGGVISKASTIAHELLNDPQDIVVLHGDLHHGNILNFGMRGWLAIDPKGLLGERGFDFANIFCNPDYEIATSYSRLEQQATIVATAANLDRTRLLKWILAYAGLSAAWHLEDGTKPEIAIIIAQNAFSMLNSLGIKI